MFKSINLSFFLLIKCSAPFLGAQRNSLVFGGESYKIVIIGIFSFFQSDVMQLTEDSTKLKLFMDVLDGTKAAVSRHSVTHFVFLVLFVDVFRF